MSIYIYIPPWLSISMAMISISLVLILAVHFGGSDATILLWCVCKPGLNATAYQTALDYSCGNGVDCNPIQENGACYMPDDERSHCSYAVNSYFQLKAQASGTCDFSGTASIITIDPTPAGPSSCVYPSTSSPTPTPTGNNTTPPLLSPPPMTPTNSANFTPTALSPYTDPNFTGFGSHGNSLSRPGTLSSLLIAVSSWVFYVSHFNFIVTLI